MTWCERAAAMLLMGAVGGLAGCGSSDGGVASGGHATGGASGGGSGGSSASSGTGGGAAEGGIELDSGGGGECGPEAPCEAGVCVEGKCCASAAQACGAECCAGATVCLFGACVTPGKTCQTKGDCAADEYCETSLGDAADAGAPDAGGADGGAACTQPLTSNGRCVASPPRCGAGGGADAGACIDDCEYRPPVGALKARKKWQWGLDIAPIVNPGAADVWSTPTVARIYDANCDGKVDESDPPNLVFVSGNIGASQCAGSPNTQPDGTTVCQRGRLRLLDGRSGKEIWTVAQPSAGSLGFAGSSVALGDVDGDGSVDIVAMTGEGKVAMIRADGTVARVSDLPIDQAPKGNYGWGGGVALGDMDGDGHPEIGFGPCVFDTLNGAITRKFCGAGGNGGGNGSQLSFFVDLDGDGAQELLAGNTAYRADGTALWTATGLPNGFNAVADFDGDGAPEVVLVKNAQLWVLEGATGAVELGPVALPGKGSGGPPTVADFDGDKSPEIGVAQATYYSMLKPDYAAKKLDVVWKTPNHDLSSSETGSSVFDFQGDGSAEVVYNDECFLWVFDGKTGHVLLSEPTTSFTGTEASVVADVDGDGHAEIVMISNGIEPGAGGWKCDVAPWNQPGTDPKYPHVAWKPPSATERAYRGITVWGDREDSWVGTRTLWNQHAYHVSNICDSRDSACDAPNRYGAIPAPEKDNWRQSWLNNFRQNVQDQGVFDAPDATVSLRVECASPIVAHVSIRNVGLAGLPAGVEAGVYKTTGGTETLLGKVTTTRALLPGQIEILEFLVPAGAAGIGDSYLARILIDPNNKSFNECRDDNNTSGVARATGCGPA
ncbi:MAG: VCBS repeat-containing protein [Sorangiineae bacterium]|nr:VCBS repeat-containing protein [Polyangiaceae bacterium]MEB2324796.1 VCBS repeat-containing protein [Sorangiineae bacterium]